MYDFSYNTSRTLPPSSHEMRYKILLGSRDEKTQKMRKKGEKVWKVVSMSGNGTMALQGDPPPIETLFLEGDPLTRKSCQPPR